MDKARLDILRPSPRCLCGSISYIRIERPFSQIAPADARNMHLKFERRGADKSRMAV